MLLSRGALQSRVALHEISGLTEVCDYIAHETYMDPSLPSSQSLIVKRTRLQPYIRMIADKDKLELAWLALLPSILFAVFDAYYLALERAFRASHNNFVKKLHGGQILVDDLFSVIPKGEMCLHQLHAFRSFSIWGFYGALVVLVLLAKELVL